MVSLALRRSSNLLFGFLVVLKEGGCADQGQGAGAGQAVQCYPQFAVLSSSGAAAGSNRWCVAYADNSMRLAALSACANTTCCFATETECRTVAKATNLNTSDTYDLLPSMGQFQITNATDHSVVSFSSSCEPWNYALRFPSLSRDLSSTARPVVGLCAPLTRCNRPGLGAEPEQRQQFQQRAPRCCNYTKYRDWLSISQGSSRAAATTAEICGQPVPCDDSTVYASGSPLQIEDRQCTNVTRCDSPAQYQDVAPTAYSDAGCTNTTQCVRCEQWETVGSATYTTDRVCNTVQGSAMCTTVRRSEGVFVNFTQRWVPGVTRISCLKASLASGWGRWIPPPGYLGDGTVRIGDSTVADAGGGQYMYQLKRGQLYTVGCFGRAVDCNAVAHAINTCRSSQERRICQRGNLYIFQNASTTDTLGCQPYCSDSQFLLSFASVKRNPHGFAGHCSPLTVCRPTEYERRPARCVSRAVFERHKNATTYSTARVPVRNFGPLVPCTGTGRSRSYAQWSDTNIDIYASDRACTQLTVCNNATQEVSREPTATTDRLCTDKTVATASDAADATADEAGFVIGLTLFAVLVLGNGWLMKNYLLRGAWFAHRPTVRRALTVRLLQFVKYGQEGTYTKSQLRDFSDQVVTAIIARLDQADVTAEREDLEVASACVHAGGDVEVVVWFHRWASAHAGGDPAASDAPLRRSTVDAETMDWLVASLRESPITVEMEPETFSSGTGTGFVQSGGWSARSLGFELFMTLASFFPGVNVWLSKEFGETVKQTKALAETVSAQLEEVDEQRAELARMRQAWDIGEGDIATTNLLASGAFGSVYRGTWGHIPVALKFLRAQMAELDPGSLIEFRKEAQLMQSINHPNLVVFHGMGKRSDGQYFIVLELMARGSLRDLLGSDAAVPWTDRARFAVEVAKAMRHLHGLGLAHRDLKSDNVLISGDMHAKVADFGQSTLMTAYRKYVQEMAVTARSAAPELAGRPPAPDADGTARVSHAERSLTNGVGTPLWRAPELLCGGNEYGLKIDVYSFGVVCWELVTRKMPWSSLTATDYLGFTKQLEEAVLSGRRPAFGPDADCPRDFRKLIEACWAGDPAARPPFDTICGRI